MVVLLFFASPGLSQVVFSDTFSGSYPGQWTIGRDGGAGNLSWAWPNDYAHTYSNPSGGQFFYPNNLHAYMDRRNVSLASYVSASLSFWYIVDTEAGFDFFTVNVRDSAGHWHELFKKSGRNDALTWTQKTLDLSQFAGQSNLIIQFRFDSDSSVSGFPYDGVFIDSVSLGGVVAAPPGVPTLTSPQNGASFPAGTSSVSLQWSANGAVSGYNLAVYTGSCGGTLFTGISLINNNFTLSGLSNGVTYYWRVQSVGPGGTSAYSNCNRFTVNNAPADLIVESVSASPATVAPGETLTVSFIVRNQGGQAAGIFSNDIRLSLDNAITPSDTLLGNRNVSSLGAGASTGTLTESLTIPAGTPPGPYHVGIIADSSGTVMESNEVNNTLGTPISVATACSTTAIAFGATVNGSLALSDCEAPHRAGRRADLYRFFANAGQEVTLWMRGNFDTYLSLVGPNGSVLIDNDDCPDDGLNSCIPNNGLNGGSFVVPTTGTYTIEATSFSSGATGTYNLSLALGRLINWTTIPTNVTAGAPLTLAWSIVGGGASHVNLHWDPTNPGDPSNVAGNINPSTCLQSSTSCSTVSPTSSPVALVAPTTSPTGFPIEVRYRVHATISGAHVFSDPRSVTINPSPARPTITSSLRILEAAPYIVGETITAEFTITNRGGVPITVDVLTVGGRIDGDCPIVIGCPDFTFTPPITLEPNASYPYRGTLKLRESGTYDFFTAYRLPDGSWNTAIDTAPAVTNTLRITVPKGAITITSPSDGERWPVESMQTIRWTSEGVSASSFVFIELSRDSGTTWRPLQDAFEANDGAFDWIVTGDSCAADDVLVPCQIRVTSLAGVTSVSDTAGFEFVDRFDLVPDDTRPLGQKLPLIAIHGWCGSQGTWQDFSNFFRNNALLDSNYKLYYFNFSTASVDFGPFGCQNDYGNEDHRPRRIRALAESLATAVANILEGHTSGEIAILAHSFGGLVARSFLQEHGGHQVTRVAVTLGTPHHGTLIANNFDNADALSGLYWDNFDGDSEPQNDWLRCLNGLDSGNGLCAGGDLDTRRRAFQKLVLAGTTRQGEDDDGLVRIESALFNDATATVRRRYRAPIHSPCSPDWPTFGTLFDPSPHSLIRTTSCLVVEEPDSGRGQEFIFHQVVQSELLDGLWETPPPSTIAIGQTYPVSWHVTRGSILERLVTHANIHWDEVDPMDTSRCSSTSNPPCSTLSQVSAANPGEVGLQFAEISLPITTTPDVYKFAAHSVVSGSTIWSQRVSANVVNTPQGYNVSVPLFSDSGLVQGNVIYSNVGQAGATTLNRVDVASPLPKGFRLGDPPTLYDISSTALFSGPVTVCINYSAVTFQTEFALRLFHLENGAWVDRTISQDLGSDTICASVLSLSPFAVLEPLNRPPTANAGGPYTVSEGAVKALIGVGEDPDLSETIVYNWDLDGDGTFESFGAAVMFDASNIDGPASRVVQLRVTDSRGATATSSATINIVNAAPANVAISPNANPVNEGAAVSFQGSFVDPGHADTHTISWNFGDSTPPAFGTLNPIHTYANNGTFSVSLTVTDDDGGSTTQTLLMTVRNAPPAIASVTNTGPVSEGSSVTVAASAIDPGLDDTLTYYFDFNDDGTFDVVGAASAASFTYGDNGVFVVRIQVRDQDGGLSSITTTSVEVNNVPPRITALETAALSIAEGDTAALSGVFADPGGGDAHSIRWSFGDGAEASGLLNPTHSYSDNGTYVVTLTITDDDGASDTSSLTISVANVAPTITALSATPNPADEGHAVSFTGAFTDPGVGDTHTIAWDFGDNNTESATLAPTHAYADNGTYTVTLTITDDDGAASTRTLVVTVNNVPPALESVTNDGPIDEGTTASFLATASDPGADALTYEFDLDNDGIFEVRQAVRVVTRTYPDDGSFAVRVRVADDDGGVSEVISSPVVVRNVPPTVSAGADVAADEGDAFASGGSFADPGTDTWTATVDYGDGSGMQALQLNADKTFALHHVYADDGSYIVRVTVRDDDGGEGAGTLTVTVRNVAPTVILAGYATVDEGNTFSDSGSFSDPGRDTWTAVVDYGDGSGLQALPLNADKSFVLSHVYGDNGEYEVTVRITDDDGGTGMEVLPVTVRNVPPTVNAGVGGTIDEGAVYAGSGSFVDPGSDTWTATVDYGDGSGVQSVLIGSGKTFDLNHLYRDDGVYTVRVHVVDDDGGDDSGELTITVRNVAPVVSNVLADPLPVNEGEPTLLTATFADPGVLDTHAVDWDFGDGTSLSDSLSKRDGTASVQQSYGEDGTYSARVRIKDDDGASDDAEMTVTVLNVPPRFEPALKDKEQLAERETLELQVRAVDVLADALMLSAEDLPAGARFVVAEGAHAGAVAGTFTWKPACDQAGDYIVLFRVADDDGAVTAKTITLRVLEACAAIVAVTNENGDSVSVIDVASNTPISSVHVGHKPVGLAFFDLSNGLQHAPAQLFVTDRGDRGAHDDDDDDDDRGDGALRILSGPAAPTAETAGDFAPLDMIQTGRRPEGLAITPDGQQLWVANRNSDSVSVFDRLTMRLLMSVPLRQPRIDRRGRTIGWTNVGQKPTALGFSRDGRYVYIVARNSKALVVIDREHEDGAAVVAAAYVGNEPSALALHPAAPLAYVATKDGVAIIDLSAPTQPRVIGSASFRAPNQSQSDVDRNRDDSDDDDDDDGDEIDGAPRGLALLADASKLYVTDRKRNVVWVLTLADSATALSLAGAIPVGRQPAGIAATAPDGLSAGQLLYIANQHDHTVSVIDPRQDRVVATVPVGKRPRGVAAAIVPTR